MNPRYGVDGTSHVRLDALRDDSRLLAVSRRSRSSLSLLPLTPITDSSIIIQRHQKYYSPFYLIFSIEYCSQIVTTQLCLPKLPGRRQCSLARVTCAWTC